VQPVEKKVLPGNDKKLEQPKQEQQPPQTVQQANNPFNNVLQEPGLHEGQLLQPEAPNPEVLNSFLNQNKLNPARQQMLDQLVEMGYDKKEAERALRAAFWDINRAVE